MGIATARQGLARGTKAEGAWPDVLARVIRIATVPPAMALLALVLLHRVHKDVSVGRGALFLVGLPLLAYPLWAALPFLRRGGRALQRKVAVAFSVAGYVAGALACTLGRGSALEQKMYLTYLCTGALIGLMSYGLGVRASGHASGCAGPAVILVAWVGLGCWPVALILPAVYWSSLRLGRHTPAELFWGSVLPVLSLGGLSFFL